MTRLLEIPLYLPFTSDFILLLVWILEDQFDFSFPLFWILIVNVYQEDKNQILNINRIDDKF